MDQDQDHPTTGDSAQQTPANAQQGDQRGKSRFLRQMSEVERQGVPEPGAVDPGPAPTPVRSGDLHAERAPQTGEREEEEQ